MEAELIEAKPTEVGPTEVEPMGWGQSSLKLERLRQQGWAMVP